MQRMSRWFASGALALFAFSSLSFAQQSSMQAPAGFNVGVINTKKALEESKLGKQEQQNFEKMKSQMESVLQEKERALQELEGQLNDDDHMDSLSDEAAAELRQKKKNLIQEGGKLQGQYLQMLQQANVKVVQKLTELVSKASKKVAEQGLNGKKLDLVISDEACTYFNPQLDVTDKLVVEMNALFETQQKENGPTGPSGNGF